MNVFPLFPTLSPSINYSYYIISIINDVMLLNILENAKGDSLPYFQLTSVSPVFEKPSGTSQSPKGTKTGDKYASGGPGRPASPLISIPIRGSKSALPQ